jgi:hypothetical protein
MKSLSLYVDKWFITVAINFDGNVIPLSLPNGEDRIWLYFHEDIANSRIEYGKAFENNYRDKQPHYFGDIFNLIEEGDHHFTRYERRREEMREIFKVAGIFNHLHQAVGEEGTVKTYISFSSDIPDVARLRFIEELEEANFKVVESVARISHLALEECKKRNVFTALGTYLVLVATNDNFHFALYENKGNIFLRKNEGSLVGLGLDVRRRALVETIVENINKNTKLLKSREEFDQECVRQDRFASTWLEKIARSRPYMPVAFDGITFAVAPNNPAIVQVFPNALDSRTTGIVEEMVRKIADFVKDNQLQPHEIEGIVFIGNTFTNQTFARAINNRFIVDDDKIVIYREEELPKVVSVYSQIDCNQFKGATEKFKIDVEAQEILKKQAKEEEEKRQKAEEDARRQQAIIDSQKKAEREYNNAVENIEHHESYHNYEEMLEWAEIALKIRPDDDFAKEKGALARQLLAEHKAANKQFNIVLQRAKTAFSEERWSDAISQCEMALELRSDSEEASRLKGEARRRMEVKEKVQELLNRADVFFAQKLYSEALREVGKILSLDPTNIEAKEIERKISDVHIQHQERINNLVAKLNWVEQENDFVSAIDICDSLIEEDSVNIRKWTSKKERIISKRKELEENQRKLDELKKDIHKAHFDEDWVRLKLLCENYLNIESDQDVLQFLSKAKKRLEEILVKEAKEKALANINGLILDGRFNEAQKELDRFAQNYTSEQSTVKDLRKKLFSLDPDFAGIANQNPPRKPIGFGTPNSTPESDGGDDDFFGTPKKKSPSRKAATQKRGQGNQIKKDDFFDSVSSNAEDGNISESKYTNNDFNF